MSYDNTNSGVFFKNEKKSEKAPDYKGKLNVNGKDFEIAGWIREGKSGKFISLKVSEPYNKAAGDAAVNKQATDVAGDSLPF